MLGKWRKHVAAGLGSVIAVLIINLSVLQFFGLLERRDEAFVVDAPTVARIFIEERGKDMGDDEMKEAIRQFDALVIAEANAIYTATGQPLVNKAHMLAGGRDVSAEFAARVIRAWDAQK